MNKNSIWRIILTAVIIGSTLAARIGGYQTLAYAIAFAGMLVLPATSVNFVLNKKYDNPLPDREMVIERFTVKFLLTSLLLLLGILLATGENRYTGIGLTTGIVLLFPLQIRFFRKQMKQVESGSVLWDERDMIIAGKAAKTVVQFQLLILPLMYLALQVFSPDAAHLRGIASAAIGLLIAVTAAAYFLIYTILRKSDS